MTAHNERKRRCPRLGHIIPFSYCQNPGEDIPCSKIYECWWEFFDIQSFMKQNYDQEVLNQIIKPAKNKTQSLLELINVVENRLMKNQK